MSGRQKRLRVGLIGAGMVSGHHLSAWAETRGAEVVAIADPDLERARERAEAFGIAAVHDSAEALIAEARPDALDIAAPVERHGDLCRLAADRGLHILCQKPLAGSYAEAVEILDAVDDRVRFMVHENWRFRQGYRQIKAWLDDGEIGAVTAARLTMTSSGLLPRADGSLPALERQAFLADMPRLLVFEVLIHHIDVLSWLLGPLALRAAELSHSCDAVRGEDKAAIRFSAPGGPDVLLEGDLSRPGAPERLCDHLVLTGQEGRIVLDDTSLSLEASQRRSNEWTPEALYASAFEGAIGHFTAALSAGTAFETEALANVEGLRMVERIYAMAAG